MRRGSNFQRVGLALLAAGSGTRFGRDKRFARLGGRSLLEIAIRRAKAALPRGGFLVIVARRGEAERLLALAKRAGVPARFAAGGATRAASARSGVASALAAGADAVLIHDAARPLLSRRVVADLLAALRAGAHAAVPALPVVDTIKEVKGDRVLRTLDRGRLVAVQTPQAFTASSARRAFLTRRPRATATDDVVLLEDAGGRVVVTQGDPALHKVTRPEDLSLLLTFLS